MIERRCIKMDKPISIVIEETKGALANIVNTSGLPISVIKLIFNELNQEVNKVADTKLSQDINKFKAAQEEPQETENSEEVVDDIN